MDIWVAANFLLQDIFKSCKRISSGWGPIWIFQCLQLQLMSTVEIVLVWGWGVGGKMGHLILQVTPTKFRTSGFGSYRVSTNKLTGKRACTCSLLCASPDAPHKRTFAVAHSTQLNGQGGSNSVRKKCDAGGNRGSDGGRWCVAHIFRWGNKRKMRVRGKGNSKQKGIELSQL